jgi:hypothetical protein
MARKRSWMVAVGVALAGVLSVGAGPAGAVIPTGNLLSNPGAELGSAASDSTAFYPPPPWTLDPHYSPEATAVRYGTPGFLTVAQGAAVGGGGAFFAGGPAAAHDDDSPPFQYAIISQEVPLPADSLADVDAGRVQLTLSGCLGGYANQDDYADLIAYPEDSNGNIVVTGTSVLGPQAAERGNQTKLLPKATSIAMPANSRQVYVRLQLQRASGHADSYNDGYADNVALQLSPAGGPTPTANCSVPTAGGGGGGSKTPGGRAKPSDSSGTNSAVGLTRVGKSVTFKHATAFVKLHCALHDSACKGTLSLTSTLPKAHNSTAAKKAKASKLGTVKFNIPAAKTKTIKVKLKRSIRERLGNLSRKRLKKLEITATAKIGSQSTKFTLGAVRKH